MNVDKFKGFYQFQNMNVKETQKAVKNDPTAALIFSAKLNDTEKQRVFDFIDGLDGKNDKKWSDKDLNKLASFDGKAADLSQQDIQSVYYSLGIRAKSSVTNGVKSRQEEVENDLINTYKEFKEKFPNKTSMLGPAMGGNDIVSDKKLEASKRAFDNFYSKLTPEKKKEFDAYVQKMKSEEQEKLKLVVDTTSGLMGVFSDVAYKNTYNGKDNGKQAVETYNKLKDSIHVNDGEQIKKGYFNSKTGKIAFGGNFFKTNSIKNLAGTLFHEVLHSIRGLDPNKKCEDSKQEEYVANITKYTLMSQITEKEDIKGNDGVFKRFDITKEYNSKTGLSQKVKDSLRERLANESGYDNLPNNSVAYPNDEDKWKQLDEKKKLSAENDQEYVLSQK